MAKDKKRRIEDFLINKIKKSGKSRKWFSQQVGINYDTFKSQLRTSNLKADTLIKGSIILGFDLNEAKEIYMNLWDEYRVLERYSFLREIEEASGKAIYNVMLELAKSGKEDLLKRLNKVEKHIGYANYCLEYGDVDGVKESIKKAEELLKGISVKDDALNVFRSECRKILEKSKKIKKRNR